jgi:predicted NBD/HSP70 family sugar kinase
MAERDDDPLYLGLDLGGTDIKATVTNARGEILVASIDKVPSLAAEGPRRTVEQLTVAAEAALAKLNGGWHQVACIGLDTPGPATVDGVIGLSPNMRHPDWNGFAIRAAFEERVRRPTIYANDGNAAAYWEYHRLFGDDDGKILAAAILGTGLGGALIWGGEVLVGARGYGGEFGHIRLATHALAPDGDVPRCGCGQLACAEAFVSVSALDHFLRGALARPEHRDHPLQALPDTGRARALRLLALAQQGDALAQSLFDRQADALGLLFVQLANACDPDVFVIGGGLTESAPAFRARYLDRVLATFRAGAFPLAAEQVRIEWAADQDQAGCRGAALLARRAHGQSR